MDSNSPLSQDQVDKADQLSSRSTKSKIKQSLIILAVALVLLALTFFFWHISQGLALVLKP